MNWIHEVAFDPRLTSHLTLRPTAPKRRQFSLRWFLVTTIGLTAFLGARVYSLLEVDLAFSAIKRRGAEVVQMGWFGPPQPFWKRLLAGEDSQQNYSVRFQSGGGDKIDDATLATVAPELKKIPNLQYLEINSKAVTTQTVKWIAELHDLRTLSLDRTGIDDGSIPYLENMKRLKYLLLQWNAPRKLIHVV